MNALLEFIKDKLKQNNNNNYYNIKKLRNNGQAVFDYDFMMSLDEKDYPKYLCEAYYIKTGQKLNLKHPKTINEKIQWLKIYDNIPIKTTLTDKVLVTDWVKEKIGEEYLKPVLWIGNKFDDIPFNELPESFVIKCNHGCKWQCIIKDKTNFVKYNLINVQTKTKIDGWLKQSFFGWSDFETQYIKIKPQIIIEPFLYENDNKGHREIEIWCFNGKPLIIQELEYKTINSQRSVSTWDENYKNINLKFSDLDTLTEKECSEINKKAAELSKILAKNFKFVRIDWMINNNKLYFCEMTFTPYSGFIIFPENQSNYQIKFGKILNLKGN